MTIPNANNVSTSLRTQIIVLGNTLSLFLAISFLLCIGWGLITPYSMHMHNAWAALLPGFKWLTPLGFLIGLVESYLYGWYIALVFTPLFRMFAKS